MTLHGLSREAHIRLRAAYTPLHNKSGQHTYVLRLLAWLAVAFWLNAVTRQQLLYALFFSNVKDLLTHAALLRQTCVPLEDSLLPPVGSLGPCLSPMWPIALSGRLCMHRLGRPLPYQLANHRGSIS